MRAAFLRNRAWFLSVILVLVGLSFVAAIFDDRLYRCVIFIAPCVGGAIAFDVSASPPARMIDEW